MEIDEDIAMAEQPTAAANAETAEQPAAEQPAGPDLNISDLASLKSIIEVATQRGAFKANELEAVGKTFNKLSTFLEAVADQNKEA